jgi:outer membrane beta-barrel protein
MAGPLARLARSIGPWHLNSKTAAMLAFGWLTCAPAFASDDDPMSDDPPTETTSDTEESSTALPGEEARVKRTIKTLEHKTFLKLGRYEAAPHIGFVTKDPFINRYLIGASFSYHITEIFALEAEGSFSPDFGEADRKAITQQLIHENRVSPDISKIMWNGSFNFQYSPIYGKVAVSGKNIVNFDIFGVFGTGVVNTKDDLDALQCEEDPACLASAVQIHPTTNFGGGVRVIFNENIAARLEGRSMIYIETIQSTTLEMKNNFMLLGSVSFFFPNME